VSEQSRLEDADRDDGSQPDAIGQSEDSPVPPPDRRRFLAGMTGATVTGGLAAGGLTASYGTFAYMAADFLYPTGRGTAWMFVAPTDQIAPGGSFSFRSPTGVAVLINRKADSPRNQIPPMTDFLALSSVCPHLGCRVHWEPQNNRFFCPCHNGAFDPNGAPIAGPPKDGNQHLPRYPLKVDERGLLFIEMPAESLVEPERNIAQRAHDARLMVKRSDGVGSDRENA
jgi:Rieske Fe-S protein